MTERFDIRDDGSLERVLGFLGEDVLFPETPNLATAFREQVTELRQPRLMTVRRWQVAALAALILVALTLSFPGARSAVASWLEFAGIRIEIGGDKGGSGDAPASLGGDLFLGHRVTLEEASSGVSFAVLAPNSPSLTDEPEIYLDHRDGTPVISMLYPASGTLPEIGDTGIGLLLMQFDPAGSSEFYIKRTVADTSPEFLTVNGSMGAWIENGSIAIPPASNRAGVERPSGHVLIWEQDGITIRMETNLTLDEALNIAGTLAADHSSGDG